MEEKVRDFLNSDLCESDYFNLSKEDLINLKEYLLYLRNLDCEFQKQIIDPVSSLKEKYDWIDSVGFNSIQSLSGVWIYSTINVFPKDGKRIFVSAKREGEEFIINPIKIPKLYMASKKVRTHVKRFNELYSCTNELKEIDDIGRQVYDRKLGAKDSISNNFEILYTPNIGMSVFDNHDLITCYLERESKQYDEPLVKDKEKLLTKIQLKKDYIN